MSETFHTSRLVEFHDTDMAGIMHFASFFVYMESAEHELLRSLGLTVHAKADEAHISFPRVSATCHYSSPAHCEDILDIAITITRIGQKSVTYEFRISCGDDEIAVGAMTSVCCLVAPGKTPVSRPIPRDMVEKLSRYAV